MIKTVSSKAVRMNRVFRLMAGVLTLMALAAAPGAGAQQGKGAGNFPERAVRWVVPFAPGASNDVIARLVAQKLTEIWGQQVLIDNRGGAGGMLGADIVAKALPNGYTMLMANPGANAINFALRAKTPYRAEDFAPVILLGWSPILLVTGAGFQANGVQDVIAMAKSRPGKLSAGSSGTGGSSHLALELFKMLAGVDILHVPYKGAAPAIVDMMAGQLQMIFSTSATVAPLVSAGKLKVLATAGNTRLSLYPNVPTTAEQGLAGYDVLIWFGVSVPAATPRPVIQKLNAGFQQALEAQELRERFSGLGLQAQGGTPDRFARFLMEEVERWSKVVKAAKVGSE
ncbi:MAG: tripartite tricarboxylate transporter substrate binding protein [Burkholderiales bacterium]|nr:tripartite tricarboxylate transporter substrate binding protein [Burkholderiales bacterium]